MTKAEIINKIAEETGVAKRDVAMSVEAFMEEIRVSLADPATYPRIRPSLSMRTISRLSSHRRALSRK